MAEVQHSLGEVQDRFNQSLVDFETALADDPRSTDEIVGQISTLPITDTRKELLVSTARRLRGEVNPPVQEAPVEVQQVPAESQQVQPLSGGSFFSEPAGSTTFFEQFTFSTSKPLPPPKANEAGFLVATGSAMYGGTEVEDIAQEVATDLSTTGSSYLMDSYLQQREQTEVNSITASLWENLEALTGIQRDPEAGVLIQQDIANEIQDVKTLDKTAQLLADVTDGLTPEQLRTFDTFRFITGETLYRRSVSSVMENLEADALSKAGIMDWVTAILNPAQPIASRYDQGKLLGIMQGVFSESPSAQEYTFKSAHANKLENYLLEDGLTYEQLTSRLNELEAVLQDVDQVGLSINPVHTAELFSVIRSEIESKAAVTEGAFIDALDATLLSVLTRPLKALSKMASVKIFGRAAASAKWTPESIAEVNRLIDSAVRESAVAGRAIDTNVISVPVQSAQGSALDAVMAANPKEGAKMLRAALEETADVTALGVTREAVAERLLPVGTNPLGVHPNHLTGAPTNSQRVNQSVLLSKFSQELTDLNPLNLLRQGELDEVPLKYAERVAKNSRCTLHPSVSPIMEEVDGNLSVLATFGKSADGGYDSIREADDAAKFLFSDNYEILAKPKGLQSELVPVAELPDTVEHAEFFVRHKANIRADSSFVNPIGSDVLFPSTWITDSVQSVSKRISKDLFDSYSNFTDKSTRLSGIASEMLAPVSKLRSGRDTDHWTRMLVHGDTEEMVFSSKEHAQSVLGTRISDRAWEAYTGTRDFYDAMAQVRQQAQYRKMVQNGFKTTYTKDGILQDPDGLVHTRPLVDRPVVSSTKDGGAVRSKEVFDAETGERLLLTEESPASLSRVWGKEIYDVETGEYLPLTDELVDSLYAGSDKIIVQLSRNAEFTNGKFSAHAIVNTSGVRELIKNPMNVRPGHVDINYKGEDLLGAFGIGYKGGNRYKVDMVVTQTVNGVEDTYRKAIGMYANQKQADDARAAMIAQEIDELADVTPEAIAAIEAKYISDITRETAMELGIDQAGTLTNLPAHARKRGERVLGYDGVAEVLNMEDALTKGVNEARNLLGVESIEFMKARFEKTFGQYITNYDGFRDKFERYVFDADAIKQGLDKQARDWHRMVQNLERSMSGKEVSLFLHHLDDYAGTLANAGKPKLAAVARGVSAALDKAYVVNKELTTTFFIASRTLYQVLANSSQMLWLAAQNPLDFATGGLKGTLATMMNIAGRGKLPNEVLARMFRYDMTGEQFEKYMKGMRESGLFSTNLADDVLSVIGSSGRVQAGKHSVLSKQFYAGLVNPAEVNRRAGNALMIPQRAAIDFANLASYNHAAAQLMRQKGVDYALSRKGQQEILANTRRLTFNQNRADQFGYQQNALSTQLQFLQHVHRMYMDLIVDPSLRAVSGNKLKVSQDGTNIYASTYGQSLMTLAGVSSMFGAGVLLPRGAEDGLSKLASDEGVPDEVIRTFMDGLVGLAVEQAFGERFDVASRLTPEGALGTTVEMMRTNDGGWIIGGASTVLPDAFAKMSRIAKAYWTEDQMTSDEAISFLGTVGTKYLAGLRDIDKAYIAAKWGTYVDSNRRPIAEVSDLAWIPLMFSIPPESVQDRYRQLDKLYSVQDEAKLITDIANRVAVGSISEKGFDTLTADDVLDATLAGFRVIDTLSQGNPNLKRLAKDGFTDRLAVSSDGILARHADKIFKTLSSKDAIAELEKLKALNPQLSNQIDTYIEQLNYKEK